MKDEEEDTETGRHGDVSRNAVLPRVSVSPFLRVPVSSPCSVSSLRGLAHALRVNI